MIRIQLHKKLGKGLQAIDMDFDLEIAMGEFVCLYGPSGAGKTSLLRLISGLLKPDSGRIEVNEEVWFNADRKIDLPPQKRSVAYLFQEYALFPNMTVWENLNFAANSKDQIHHIRELVEITEIEDLLQRKPDTLSGGQQQRVALARALVPQPQLLLLDEPLSALDPVIRQRLQEYLLLVRKKYKMTVLMVSHDLAEIYKLSDRVMELQQGTVVRTGNATKLFTGSSLSGKFSFVGEVLDLHREDVVYVLTVLIGKELVKVIASESEVGDIRVSDKIMVTSKAFNPIIRKIN